MHGKLASLLNSNRIRLRIIPLALNDELFTTQNVITNAYLSCRLNQKPDLHHFNLKTIDVHRVY